MESIIVAIITGGLSLLGVLIANGRSSAAVDAKLDKQQAVMETKIDELARKVQAHNNLVERTYRLEERTELQEEKIKAANHRIEALERA